MKETGFAFVLHCYRAIALRLGTQRRPTSTTPNQRRRIVQKHDNVNYVPVTTVQRTNCNAASAPKTLFNMKRESRPNRWDLSKQRTEILTVSPYRTTFISDDGPKPHAGNHVSKTGQKRLPFHLEKRAFGSYALVCAVFDSPCYGATVEEIEQDLDEEDIEDFVAFSIESPGGVRHS